MSRGVENSEPDGKESSLPRLPILFFDSSCLLCHRSIRWIIRQDPGAIFSFASLDSQAAVRWIPGDHPLREQDTVILRDGDGIFGRSEAVFRTLRQLQTLAKVLLIFSIFPRAWTDLGYRFVAARRYRWFGRDESCPLPDPTAANRFLK